MSNFIIGLMIFCLFIGVISIAAIKLNESYPINSYTSSNLAAYNQLNKLGNLTKQIDSSSNLEQNSGVLDLIGAYIGGAYNALKVSKASVNNFNEMSEEATNTVNLGEMTIYFKIAFAAIILIIIILSILLSALVSKEL